MSNALRPSRAVHPFAFVPSDQLRWDATARELWYAGRMVQPPAAPPAGVSLPSSTVSINFNNHSIGTVEAKTNTLLAFCPSGDQQGRFTADVGGQSHSTDARRPARE